MVQEIKDKWVAALRSGEYRQTSYQLKRNYPSVGCSWCALGVLCQLAVDEGITNEYVFQGIGLTREVSDWAELPSFFGEVKLPTPVETSKGMAKSIMALNDVLDCTFPQIADIIEEQF